MGKQPSGQSPARVDLANAIRAVIERTGLGLERLAAKLTDEGVPVSDSALSRYQRGQALPPRSVLIALARIKMERSERAATVEPHDQPRRRTSLDDLLELLARAEESNEHQSAEIVDAGPPTSAPERQADHSTSPYTRWRLDDNDHVPSWAVPLAAAADALAEGVSYQWHRAAGDRRLLRPTPIPVRWCRSQRPVTGPVEEAVGDPQARPLFPVLPNSPAATAATLRAGGLHDLFTVYSGLDSGRVVILGGPGTGKSAAAILTLLDALKHRRGLNDGQRATVPVPVLLTTHGWDPRYQRLEAWLAERLADDYPVLRSGDYGRDAAERLVKAGHVALFLDGLDEMAPTLRRIAVDAINRQATSLRLVVLTRSDEFATAASAGHLYGAVALELSPVPAADAADYLKRCQTESVPPPWQRLITHLREHPHSVLSSALDSPLNLTLIRDAFPDPAEIDELLTPGRFGSRGEVEDHLLDRIVPVAYQPVPAGQPRSYLPEEAQQALGYIATQMNAQNTRDLAWWRTHHWASPISRILADGLLGLIAGALIGALAFGPLGQYTVRGSTGTLFGIGYGSGMGLLFGLLVGLVSEFRERRPLRASRLHCAALRSSRFNLAVGLLVGLAAALAVGNQSHYVFGVPAGLLVGLAAGRAATRVRPDSRYAARSWWKGLQSKVDLVSGCLAGLPIGLAYGFTKELTYGLAAGVVSMFAFGLMVGFSRPSAEDSVTDPEASWRRDRRRGVTFGLASGIPLGIALGIGNGVEEGLLSGIVAGIGFGVLIGLGGMAAVSDTWRTTLLFLQLRRHGIPMLGMSFLKDAYDRDVLRTVGPICQFRHARLQDRLAETYQRNRPARSGWEAGAPARCSARVSRE